jgi:hypothetical protein
MIIWNCNGTIVRNGTIFGRNAAALAALALPLFVCSAPALAHARYHQHHVAAWHRYGGGRSFAAARFYGAPSAPGFYQDGRGYNGWSETSWSPAGFNPNGWHAQASRTPAPRRARYIAAAWQPGGWRETGWSNSGWSNSGWNAPNARVGWSGGAWRSTGAFGGGALDGMAMAAASTAGVPLSLVQRVIARESGGNPGAVHAGNYGLMQIRLGTARAMGYSGSAAGLLDPQTNMTYAVRYLAGAYRAAGGDENRAVALYARGYYAAARARGFSPYTMM